MSSILDVMNQCSEKLAKPLSMNEAMLMLGKALWERIESVVKLTPDTKKILKYFASTEDYISQNEVAEIFKKSKSNISGYYFKQLKDNNIIEEKERRGKVPHYGLTVEYEPLKWLMKSQEEVDESLESKSKQVSFNF